MRKEFILKSHASAADRRDLKIVGVLLIITESEFVEGVRLVTLSEGLYYNDNTDLSAV